MGKSDREPSGAPAERQTGRKIQTVTTTPAARGANVAESPYCR